MLQHQENPEVLIRFDATTMNPKVIFYNGSTDRENEQLRKVMDKMLSAIEETNENE